MDSVLDYLSVPVMVMAMILAIGVFVAVMIGFGK